MTRKSDEEAPKCTRCGRMLHTGEGRLLIGFTVTEAEELAYATSNPVIRARLACAVGILDTDRERQILAMDAPRVPGHPPSADVDLFVDGELDPTPRADAFRVHVADCATCQLEVERAMALRAQLSTLRGA